jgi:hypothetical protein
VDLYIHSPIRLHGRRRDNFILYLLSMSMAHFHPYNLHILSPAYYSFTIIQVHPSRGMSNLLWFSGSPLPPPPLSPLRSCINNFHCPLVLMESSAISCCCLLQHCPVPGRTRIEHVVWIHFASRTLQETGSVFPCVLSLLSYQLVHLINHRPSD